MNVNDVRSLPNQASVAHAVRLDVEKLNALQTQFAGDDSAALFFSKVGEIVRPKPAVPLSTTHHIKVDDEGMASLQARFVEDESAREFFRTVRACAHN